MQSIRLTFRDETLSEQDIFETRQPKSRLVGNTLYTIWFTRSQQ